MACNCCQSDCNICNSCTPPNPCDPCTSSSPALMCPQECDLPVYTNTGCFPEQKTGCVVFDGTADTCVPFAVDDNLNTVLANVVNYIKDARERLIPDDSIDVTSIDDDCDDKANIKVNISEDENNIIELRADGLYASNDVSGLIDFCAEMEEAVGAAPDDAQKNTESVVTYDFVGIDIISEEDCQIVKLSPPTGFAVTGDNRVSAFGKMEWFDTLVDANNSATSGETVLIYTDTVEDLTIKAGVSYQGVGMHSVGLLTGSAAEGSAISHISNLKTGRLALSNYSRVESTNVEISGQSAISGNAEWRGSLFNEGEDNGLVLLGNAVLSQARVNCFSSFYGNTNTTHCIFIDSSDYNGGTYFVNINNTEGGLSSDDQCVFSNNYIHSFNNPGLFVITRGGTNIRSIVSNNTIKTNTRIGALVHLGGLTQEEAGTVFSYNTISNYGADPALRLYNVSGSSVEPAVNETHNHVVGNIAYSVTGAGISSYICGMKDCHGYSETKSGIEVDNQENKSSEIRLIDCTGESKGEHGLYALRDIYVVGGTYISGKDAADGNPIFLSSASQNGVVGNNYFIAGVKTLAYNTSAYGIQATTAVNAKIVGCIFLNERIPFNTPVPGINTTNITLSTVTIDAYGNIS